MKHALRTLLKTPGLSLVIIVSLAVGIGTNTVIFSWLKGAAFQPLPRVDAPVWSLEVKDDTGGYVATSWLEFRDLRTMLPSFDLITAQRGRAFYLGESERDSRVFGQLVGESFFEVLGLRPQLGRFFRSDETTRPGEAPVAVISHEFWQGYFKGAPDVIGRTLTLNHRALTVIGVAPEGFRGGMNSLGFDVWLPVTIAPLLHPASSELTNRATRSYVMLARLKPGATPGNIRGELDAAARQMIAAHPETNKGLHYELLPLWRVPRGGEVVVVALATLQVFAALILIVVCANTANLLLARASARQREIGVKLALGAGPTRLIFQLLLESVLLALVGAALGLVLALWGIDALKQFPVPGAYPVKITPELDALSLTFAIVLAVGCGIAFGLAPAWQLARGDVLQALRGGRGSIGGRSVTRDALVGLQVAIGLVVLVLAGLFLKSFRNSLSARPGFDQHRVMLGAIDLGGRGYTRETSTVLLERLLDQLRATPGVTHAAAASLVPLDLRGLPTGVISVQGKPFDSERKILYYGVSPGYFATMGMPLLDGRDLAPLGRADLPLDAVINEEMARRYWPEGSPVGRKFEVNGTTYEIMGVVRNAKYQSLNEAPRPLAWLTLRTQFVFTPTLHVRAEQGDPRALLSAMRTAVRSLDPELTVIDPRSLAQHVDNNLFMQRVPARMLSVLGPLALALPAIGLYAVLAYSLAQRTQEIGVRLTLGATPRSVVLLMIWQHMRIVLMAAALGWLGAFGLGYYLRNSFVGVSLVDPLIHLGAPLLLLAIATLACWLPARKAADVDPMAALRTE
jgi:predicted permease